MTDWIVYEHPLSPYAQKVKLALHFKGIPFEAMQPAIGDGTSDFAKLSPRGEVPLLRHGDAHLYHSPVMLAYIEEVQPQPVLLPAQPLARANVRLIEDALDTHFEANTWALGEIRIFARAEGDRADELCAIAEKQIRGWYRWLDGRLGERDWFNGTQYGYADLCVVPFVNGATRFDILPEENSQLAAWLQRVNERADVAEVTRQAQAAELDPATMQTAVAAGFKREYRDHRLEWMVRNGALAIVADGLDADNIRFNACFPT